ncbi:hypothetical protein OH77DRAFT_1419098 [Trametes cingulata]|nr:hypothetical protein OH77DRAFT_1419098 [Trametes cingulata]
MSEHDDDFAGRRLGPEVLGKLHSIPARGRLLVLDPDQPRSREETFYLSEAREAVVGAYNIGLRTIWAGALETGHVKSLAKEKLRKQMHRMGASTQDLSRAAAVLESSLHRNGQGQIPRTNAHRHAGLSRCRLRRRRLDWGVVESADIGRSTKRQEERAGRRENAGWLTLESHILYCNAQEEGNHGLEDAP